MYRNAAERMGNCRVCALLLALALVFVSFFAPLPPARAESDGMVRVKLTRLGAPTEIVLTADCDYYLASDASVRIPSGRQFTLKAQADRLALNTGSGDVDLGSSAKLMRAASGAHGARFIRPELSNRFCGDLGFTASDGVITTVLNIYIEDYLCGVVGYEMLPSSPIEALKAQAVASRTYALRRKADRRSAAYDLTDTAADQVFKGQSSATEYDPVVRAVNATRGGVLYYGNSLAQCWYSASNGGQTESARNAWGVAAPYTQVVDDPYDYESGAASRTAVINKDATGMHPSLKSALIEGMREQLSTQNLSTAASDIRVNRVESITACESRYPAASRVYKSLTVKLNVTGLTADGSPRTGTVAVSIPTFGGVENWYDLSLNADDNETVWVTETDRAFEITFRRQGHGVGMSQRGAQRMAAEYGMTMSDILSYYYPGTEGKVLSLTDTTRDRQAAEPPAQQAVIATARLRDRTDLLSAPDSTAAAAATIAAGAVVDVYAVQGEWAAVGSGGRYGYVAIDRLSSFALTGAKVTQAEGEVYARAQANLTLRKLPVEDAATVTTAGVGVLVRVYAWTDAWAMIKAPNGSTGFVPMSALKLEDADDAKDAGDDGSDAIRTPENLYAQLKRDEALRTRKNASDDAAQTLYQGTVVKVLAYNSEWAKVRTQEGREGFVPLSSLSAIDADRAQGDSDGSEEIEGGPVTRVSGRKYLYVQASSVNVYESWSTGSQVIAALRAGERVQVGAYNTVWACVRTQDGKQGFVQVSQMSAEPPASSDDGVVYQDCNAETTAQAALRDSVSSGANTVAVLPQGARVRVRAWNDTYAYVEYNGIAGFVRLDCLKRVD